MDADAPTRSAMAWTLVVTAAAGFMAALDNLVVANALIAIHDDIGGTLADLEWTVNAYTLPLAVLMLAGAAAGDRFGRRRVFVLGMAFFTAGSAMAATADSVAVLVAARAVQGTGAAAVVPLTLTLLSEAVPPSRRATVFGIWVGVNGVAVAAGPLIGGVLTQWLSWHWIFWLNVPLGLVVIACALLRLAESRGPNDRLDLVGTALVSAGLLCVVYALIRGHADGWTSFPVVTGLIAGPCLVLAFLVHESRTPSPLLPLGLFRHSGFAAINAGSAALFFGLFGGIFLLSQYRLGNQGFTPVEVGLRTLPWTAMPMLVAPFTGLLSRRVGQRAILQLGFVLQASGLLYYALMISPRFSYAVELPALLLSGLGTALYFGSSSLLVMNSVPRSAQGIASGVHNAFRELGGVFGVAVMSGVLTLTGSSATAVPLSLDGLRWALASGAAVVVAGALVLGRGSR